MKDLRTRLIKAAWDNPEIRPDILRLLQADQSKIALRLKEMQKLLSKGHQFGVLSAYGPMSKSQNKQRNVQLHRDLAKRGYNKVETLRGKWEGVSEKSVLVPGIAWKDLLKLGKKYDQDAVIYKSPDGVIGMYYQKAGKAEFAMKPDGDMAVALSTGKDLYSKARGISFEFGVLWGQGVPWDRSTPFSKEDVRQMVLPQAA